MTEAFWASLGAKTRGCLLSEGGNWGILIPWRQVDSSFSDRAPCKRAVQRKREAEQALHPLSSVPHLLQAFHVPLGGHQLTLSCFVPPEFLQDVARLGMARPPASATSPPSTGSPLPRPASIPAQEPGESGYHRVGVRAGMRTSRERGLRAPRGEEQDAEPIPGCRRGGAWGYRSQEWTGKPRWGERCLRENSRQRPGESGSGFTVLCAQIGEASGQVPTAPAASDHGRSSVSKQA